MEAFAKTKVHLLEAQTGQRTARDGPASWLCRTPVPEVGVSQWSEASVATSPRFVPYESTTLVRGVAVSTAYHEIRQKAETLFIAMVMPYT